MGGLCNQDEVFTARCELILWLLPRQKLTGLYGTKIEFKNCVFKGELKESLK